MNRVFIAFACRTPVVPRFGVTKSTPFYNLAAPVLRSLEQNIRSLNQLSRPRFSDKPWTIHSVIAGNALGAGGNPARLMSLAAGLPEGLPALSVDSQCCSGLDAIGLAFHRIRGFPPQFSNQIILAGGAESASLAPIRLNRETQEAYEQAPFTPWPNRDPDMIEAALALEEKRDIPKSRMVQWALRSYRLSVEDKIGSEELISPKPGVTKDTLPRLISEALCEKASLLGRYNACLMAPLADAAAFSALLCLDESTLELWKGNSREITQDHQRGGPLEILDYHQIGADPELPGLSCSALLPWLEDSEKRFNFSRSELTVALMESFSSQVLSSMDDLGLREEQVNPWGGLLARGHPVGASGAILVWDLFRRLMPGQLGLAAIPAAGGLASALLVRRV
jgi:acetyl-CoA C-acetyltransferase